MFDRSHRRGLNSQIAARPCLRASLAMLVSACGLALASAPHAHAAADYVIHAGWGDGVVTSNRLSVWSCDKLADGVSVVTQYQTARTAAAGVWIDVVDYNGERPGCGLRNSGVIVVRFRVCQVGHVFTWTTAINCTKPKIT
jgi:hypothetical protein